ncbi:NUDIX domain-containing protein [Massilia sp. W12]|uniref:NUDIX domain-containing protein n=1 Tax=Massilia sp. W12 TaxID=3126507 RepID=UPI0030D4A6AD
MSEKIIDVAVGVLLQPDGRALFAQRPPGKPYAGYWEFPGGKVEAGETVFAALQREFAEELGVQVLQGAPWQTIEHSYPHAHVRLHFWLVRDWQGEPRGLEGQAFGWYGRDYPQPLLPATIPLMSALDLQRFAV